MSANAQEIRLKELYENIRSLNSNVQALSVRLADAEKRGQEAEERERAASKRNEELEKENKNLNEQVKYLKKKLFAHSSEKKILDIPGQLSFFNEIEAEPEPSVEEQEEEKELSSEETPRPKKKRRPKTSMAEKFKGIPVRKEVLDLSDEQKICSECGSTMEKIGETFVRREFHFIPARGEIIEYYSANYECGHCKKYGLPKIYRGKDGKAHMLHGMCSSGTIAWIMYQKYANHMPLYRQEADFGRSGIPLDRATMGNWVIKNSEDFFFPVYQYLRRQLLLRHFAMADETPCQVLKEDGKRPESTSYMWVFRSGEDGGHRIILYKYADSRSGDIATQFLEGFQGYLMTDGYSGYNKVKGVKRCACFAHIRRYLADAIPKGNKNDLTLPAVQGFLYVEKLFTIERAIKAKYEGDFDAIKEQRLKREKPVIDAFLEWTDKQMPVKGSRFAKAITYIQNRRSYLETYLEDGRCSFSNNGSENSVRPLTLGRKNFLFYDTPKGARASEAVYTIVELARVNSVNIYRYLEFLLDKMPLTGNSDEEIEKLMPWNDDVKEEVNNRVMKAMMAG